MANISALVDYFLHPEIPYFDSEHLIVGGITAFVSATLISGLAFYLRSLVLAEERIKRLESHAAICMYCKKVRPPGVPADLVESWQSIESFVLRRFDVRFSHGMCPDCEAHQFPQVDTV